MKFNQRLFLPLLLVFSAFSVAAVAEASGKPQSYTFRVMAWNRELLGVKYFSGKKQEDLDIHCGILSGKMHLDGDGKLTLMHGPASAGGEGTERQFATLTLQPEPAGNLVMVWIDHKQRCQAIVVPDTPDAPLPGQARFVNVTNRHLSIQCNGEVFLLGPGATAIVPGDGRGVRVKVAMRKPKTGEWVLAAMNAVRLRPETRVSIFIADPAEMAPPEKEADYKPPQDKLILFVVADHVEASTGSQ